MVFKLLNEALLFLLAQEFSHTLHIRIQKLPSDCVLEIHEDALVVAS